MPGTRNQIYDALFALIGSAAFATPINGQMGFVTKEQRLRLWSSVDATEQPYFCLTLHKQTFVRQSANLPPKRLLPFTIYCYTPTGDREQGVIGSHDLNVISDAIDVAMQPDNPIYGRLTLGGLCERAMIDGEIFVDPGDIDSQALLFLAATVVMP